MDYMDALLTPASDDEQLAALSDSLRGRKRAADFFALSTIGNISDAAKSEQEAVLKSAERQGMLRRAMAERQQREQQAQLSRDQQQQLSEYAQGQQNQRLERTLANEADVRAEQADAQLPVDYETPEGEIVQGRMQGGMLVDMNGIPIPKGSRRYSARVGNKPGAKLLQGYIKSKGLDEQISGLDAFADDLPEKAKDQLNNTTGEVFLDVVKKGIPGTAADLASRNSLYTHPKAQQAMEKFARLESEVLNLISGKQITGLEADKVNKWSPNYPGLTLEQRIRRAKNLQERIRQEMSSFETYYKDWSLRDQGQEQPATGGIEYLGPEE